MKNTTRLKQHRLETTAGLQITGQLFPRRPEQANLKHKNIRPNRYLNSDGNRLYVSVQKAWV